MRTTQGAVLCAINEPLELRELRIADLKPGQVLVEVHYSGVCHSQLHEIRGRRGPDAFLPHTLGHEGSGIVLEVGAGVAKVQPGNPVVLTWIKGSGQDVPGTTYGDDRGNVNSGAISTFMRHAVVSENRVVPLPAEMPLREAALLGCAIPTGAGIVVNTADVKPGSSVAIFGVGGIGLSALLAARLRGAERIIAVDVAGDKLDFALRLGATHAVNAREKDPVAAIMELSAGKGVDFGIECAGRRESMESAFRCVRHQGGLCILAGNLPQGETIALDPMDLIRGKRIVGTWGGETRPDVDLPRYAQWFLEGRLPLTQLISKEYPLEQVNAALDDLERGRVARGLLNLKS